MLTNVISAGKDIANKIGNKILNLTEIESKIKEATSDEPWGPHASLMKEISEETFSSMNFNEIMTFLWYRIFTERPSNARRIYKGLVLLNYILLNGSDYVAKRCKDHIEDVRRLENYSDANRTSDASIRKKAADICDLLNDSQRLKLEREKAKTNQARLYCNTSGASDLVDGERQPTRAQSLGDFDSWEPKSKSIPYVIGESFVNFVNTFTQNISGPPPTETHDNFDLPTYYNSDPRPEKVADPKPSDVVKDYRCAHKTGIKGPPKVEPVASTVVVDEAPIIDFSDPAPTATGFDSGFLADFGQIHSAVKVQDDDFGDFSGWDNQAPARAAERPLALTQANDFYPNFDMLARTQSNTPIMDQCTPKPNDAKVLGSQPKENSGLKLGSTWNDMGSLKIDLDNVCGTRRPMYSSS